MEDLNLQGEAFFEGGSFDHSSQPRIPHAHLLRKSKQAPFDAAAETLPKVFYFLVQFVFSLILLVKTEAAPAESSGIGISLLSLMFM